MNTPVQTFSLSPSKPQLRLPAGACDAHVHVFGPAAKFPFSENRNFTPADASKEKLFALHKHLGISRCVIVQSAIHGFDNSAAEDAIAAGGGHYLGVALAPHTVTDAELERLRDVGFRGIRFNFMPHLANASSPEQVMAMTQRLAPLGMHLQVHFASSLVHELGPIFKKSAVPVVIDHMGRVNATLGAEHADFRALCTLMQDPLFYVKVSGTDRIDATPPYTQGLALARELVASFPDRCVWGTDWPHPNHTHMPDDGELVDLIGRIAPTPDLLQKLMVDNPQKLYRFEA